MRIWLGMAMGTLVAIAAYACGSDDDSDSGEQVTAGSGGDSGGPSSGGSEPGGSDHRTGKCRRW